MSFMVIKNQAYKRTSSVTLLLPAVMSRGNAAFEMTPYSGQLFLNCDSFIFTSLALSVTCTCIGLSVLWS